MSRVFSDILNNIQYIGIVVATITALISAATTTRDPATNRLTRWGKVSTTLILVALATSLAAQWKSSAEERNKERSERARLAAVLRGIDQAVNPLSNLRLNYSFALPTRNASTSSYESRLASLSSHARLAKQASYQCLTIVRSLGDKAFFFGRSSWMPRDNAQERMAYLMSHYVVVALDFYTHPERRPWLSQLASDLHLLVAYRRDGSTCIPAENVDTYSRTLSFEPRSKLIEVSVNNESVQSNGVSPGAPIVSLVDLAHTALLISFWPGTEYLPDAPTALPQLEQLLPRLHLTHFSFVLGPREFELALARCPETRLPSGVRAYECALMSSVLGSTGASEL